MSDEELAEIINKLDKKSVDNIVTLLSESTFSRVYDSMIDRDARKRMSKYHIEE